MFIVIILFVIALGLFRVILSNNLSKEEIGQLNQVSITGTVGLWSCNGGTGGTSSVANALSGRVYGWPVVALVDGSVTYRDWSQPMTGFPLTKTVVHIGLSLGFQRAGKDPQELASRVERKHRFTHSSQGAQ